MGRSYFSGTDSLLRVDNSTILRMARVWDDTVQPIPASGLGDLIHVDLDPGLPLDPDEAGNTFPADKPLRAGVARQAAPPPAAGHERLRAPVSGSGSRPAGGDSG